MYVGWGEIEDLETHSAVLNLGILIPEVYLRVGQSYIHLGHLKESTILLFEW
jgi:hypothetical protein